MKLSSSLFPGVPGDVLVHNGFRDAHSATASPILTEVTNLISSKGATNVVTVSLFRFVQVRVVTDRDRL